MQLNAFPSPSLRLIALCPDVLGSETFVFHTEQLNDHGVDILPNKQSVNWLMCGKASAPVSKSFHSASKCKSNFEDSLRLEFLCVCFHYLHAGYQTAY